jgi:Chaperone of endosialidase
MIVVALTSGLDRQPQYRCWRIAQCCVTTVRCLAGGADNVVSNSYGFVGGGAFNTASGDSSVVGGGLANNASGDGSFIGAGVSNLATGGLASIAGGYSNSASAAYATVPGGFQNVASGQSSFPAGTQAQALYGGEFVWADNSPNNFEPGSAAHGWTGAAAANTFNARETGGVWFVTGLNSGQPASWVFVNPGSGTWAGFSDRAAKENFRAIDAREILEKIEAMPIETWNYITEGRQVRHLGPVSQDFFAAFQPGPNDKTITHLDEGGVALAAIQGLYRVVREKDARIAALEQRLSEMETLRGEVATVRAVLAEMKEAREKLAAH